MSGAFDPYYKWLGIPPKDQPANHYRLLALELFESDPDVISSAADQRMGHVRAFQTGQHSALSQQILNELAAARVCLLNAERKATYDRSLRGQLGTEVPQAVAAPVQPSAQPAPAAPLPPEGGGPATRTPGPARPRRRFRRLRVPWQGLIAILVAAVIFLVVLILLAPQLRSQWATRAGPQPVPGEVRPASDPPEEATSPTKVEPAEPPGPKPAEPTEAEVADPPSGPASSAKAKPAHPEPKPEVEPTPEPADAPSPSAPAPVPDAAALADAQTRLADMPAGATAADLMKAARAEGRAAGERFVLLRKTRDTAAAAGDVEAAWAAVEEIIRHYEVDPLEARIEAFTVLHDSTVALDDSAAKPAAARAVAEKGLALIDEIVTAGDREVPQQVVDGSLRLASQSGDTALFRKVTLRVIGLEEEG